MEKVSFFICGFFLINNCVKINQNCMILPVGHKIIPTAKYIWGGWSGVGVGEAGLNRIVKTALSVCG